MISPADMRQLIENMYAAHAVLWTLGFTPDELFVSAPKIVNAPEPGNHATLYVRRGGLQFTYWMEPRLEREEAEQFLRGWAAFAERADRIPIEDRNAMVRRSLVWRTKHELLRALLAKGFTFTAIQN
jgi:hypothetical protein